MRPRRQSLGQHFLHDHGIVQKILRAAAPGKTEHVLEIGAGPGILTKALGALGVNTTALELDPRLFKQLKKELEESGLTSHVRLIHGDALKFPFQSIASPFVVIGNLPYSISTPLLFRLLEFRSKISRMILMVQREVADRIAAGPGNKTYGPLSIGVQLYAEPRILFRVPPGCFKPPPRVQSSVIQLTIHEKPRVTMKDEAFFLNLVRKSFTRRRKTLRNALIGSGFSPETVATALDETALIATSPNRRGETLSIEEWGRLADKLFEISTKL